MKSTDFGTFATDRRRLLELGLGDLTTGREDGARYIHVCEEIEQCAHWIQAVREFSQHGLSWYIVRFRRSATGVETFPDPKSDTGLVLGKDCIPPGRLEYRYGEDCYPGQGEEIAGVPIWKPMRAARRDRER